MVGGVWAGVWGGVRWCGVVWWRGVARGVVGVFVVGPFVCGVGGVVWCCVVRVGKGEVRETGGVNKRLVIGLCAWNS